ncbi:MAG: hypothetical protein WB471_08585 [Nocardioides sp.]
MTGGIDSGVEAVIVDRVGTLAAWHDIDRGAGPALAVVSGWR